MKNFSTFYRWGDYTFNGNEYTINYIIGLTESLDPDYDLDYVITRLLERKYNISFDVNYNVEVYQAIE